MTVRRRCGATRAIPEGYSVRCFRDRRHVGVHIADDHEAKRVEWHDTTPDPTRWSIPHVDDACADDTHRWVAFFGVSEALALAFNGYTLGTDEQLTISDSATFYVMCTRCHRTPSLSKGEERQQ